MTTRFLRTSYQWTKITRDQRYRQFTLARGHNGCAKAHHYQVFSFRYLPNWAEAEALALRNMETYA